MPPLPPSFFFVRTRRRRWWWARLTGSPWREKAPQRPWLWPDCQFTNDRWCVQGCKRHVWCAKFGFLCSSLLPQCRVSLALPPAFSLAGFVWRLHKHPLSFTFLPLLLSRLMPVVLSRVFEFFLSLPPVLLTSSVLLPSYISSDFASSCTICTLISPPFSHYPGPLLFFWLSLSAATERNFPLTLKPCNNFTMLSFLSIGPCQRWEIFLLF